MVRIPIIVGHGLSQHRCPLNVSPIKCIIPQFLHLHSVTSLVVLIILIPLEAFTGFEPYLGMRNYVTIFKGGIEPQQPSYRVLPIKLSRYINF